MIFFPSWSSHFIDPNRHNDTNVFLSFAIQNPSGVHDFDWEDDGIGAPKGLEMPRNASF